MHITEFVPTGEYQIKLSAEETKTLRDILDGLTESPGHPLVGDGFDFCADLLVSIGGPLR